MMKKGKKILSILLSMILVLGLVPADGAGFVLEKMGAWIEVQAAETVSASGTCGDNLTWELSEDGVLTISGTGEMDDWNSSANFGWSSMRNQIKKVVINDGVTNIPSYAFYLCVNLAEISIPDGITSVGNYAFGNCTILKEIDLPDSVVSIGRSAFAGCDNLREISIPARVTDISQYAFAGCDKLASVGIPDGVVSINSYAFSVCKGLTNIYYEGLEEDWIQIDIDDQGNTYLLDAIIHYNSLLPKEGFYAIQIAPDIEFGSISVINSSEKGNEVTVNVYPDEGYILKKLTIETENGEKIIALNQSENIYTFTMPDSNVTISAQFQSTAFYFGELLSYKNVEYALVGDTITLYGVIHNEEENFDIDSAIESVDWEFSDEESLELVSFNYTGQTDMLDSNSYIWGLTIRVLKHGNVTITGTMQGKYNAKYSLALEPKMVISFPERAETGEKITCTVSLENEDYNYLEEFMNTLTVDFEYLGVGKNILATGSDYEFYEISDDGKTAVYTFLIDVTNNSGLPNVESRFVEFTFVSKNEQTYTETINIYGRDETVFSMEYDPWCIRNNGTEIPLSYFKQFFPEKQAEKLYKKNAASQGICYGMAETAAMMKKGIVSAESFGEKNVIDIIPGSQTSGELVYNGKKLTALEWMKYVFLYQYTEQFSNELNSHDNGSIDNDYDTFVATIKKSIDNKVYPHISIRKNFTGHSLLAIGYKELDDTFAIQVYDSNYNWDDNRYLYIKKENGKYTGWFYQIEDEDENEGIKGTIWSDGILSFISYTSDLDSIEAWLESGGLTVGENQSSGKTISSDKNRLISSLSDDFKLSIGGEEVDLSYGETSDQNLAVPIVVSSDSSDAISEEKTEKLFWASNKEISYNANEEDIFSVTDREDSFEFCIPEGTTVTTSVDSENGKTARISGTEKENVTVTFSQMTGDEKIDYIINGTAFDTIDFSVKNGVLDVSGFNEGKVTIVSEDKRTEQSFTINEDYVIHIEQNDDNGPEMSILQEEENPQPDNSIQSNTDTIANSNSAAANHPDAESEKISSSPAENSNITVKKTKLKSVKQTNASKVKIKWKRNTSADGYQIQYATKKSFKKAKTININKNKTNQKTIKKLKQSKKYYFRIRSVKKINNQKYYSAWSNVKKVKLKK
ncbi:Fibronectin type III domain protein [Eubacteriaceae bacterium CHKCI004]|nr:Fibronectin type III domain protein [Eubacteriaceae bacterium CHKCI004]